MRGGGVIALFSCFLTVNSAYSQKTPQSLGGSCSLDSLYFVSVTIGNINKAPDITIPVNMTCTFNAGPFNTNIIKGGMRVGYCWHLHNDGPKAFQYRQVGLVNWRTEPFINYNFYGHGGKKVGGDGTVSGGQYNMFGWATGSGLTWHMTDSIIMRFENNAGKNLTPGTYKSDSTTASKKGFHAHMLAVDPMLSDTDYTNPSPWCRTGAINNATNNITGKPEANEAPQISVNVRTYCNTSIKNQAAFPIYASLRDVKPITATLNVDCTAGTHYRVTSDMGLHAVGSQRYMKGRSSGSMIAYNIDSINTISPHYTPVSLTEWTDYGNGTPAGINYAIQLSIPRQPTPPDDTYTDTIVYTVTHIPESGDITD